MAIRVITLLLLCVVGVECGILENAGCHSNYNEDRHKRFSNQGNDFVSAVLNNGKSISIMPLQSKSSNSSCMSYDTLHYVICPSALLSSSLCIATDMCPLIGLIYQGGKIFDVVITGNFLYFVTEGFYLYGCSIKNEKIVGCNMIYIQAEQYYFVKLALTKFPLQVHVVYDYSDDSLSHHSVYANVCDASLTKCSFNNVTGTVLDNIVNSDFPRPSPTIIKDKIHISISGNDTHHGIYTCDYKSYSSCSLKVLPYVLRQRDYGGLVSAISSAYLPNANTYYMAYSLSDGSLSSEKTGWCSIKSNGSINVCNNLQPTLTDDAYISGDASISLASYLNSIVVAYMVTGLGFLPNSAVYVIRYDAGKENNPLHYKVKGFNNLGAAKLLNIDPTSATITMVSTASYAYGLDYFYTSYIDMFPSVRGNTPFLKVSLGYRGNYPQHGMCHGLIADEVSTCTSRMSKDGTYFQRVIFTGKNFKLPKVEDQPCAIKLLSYPHGSNPHSTDACIGNIGKYSYFDDGPSVPVFGRVLTDLLLFIVGHETSLVYWRGGVLHDWCYHNTVAEPSKYNDKGRCDNLALTAWLDDCKNHEKKNYFDTSKSLIVSILIDIFSFIGDITCEAVAEGYYAAIHDTNVADGAYVATNSNVTIPSKYVDKPLIINKIRLKSISNVLANQITKNKNNTVTFNSSIIMSEISKIPH